MISCSPRNEVQTVLQRHERVGVETRFERRGVSSASRAIPVVMTPIVPIARRLASPYGT